MNDNMENPKFSSLSKDISKVNIIISIWRKNLSYKNDIYLISIKKSVVLRWEKESSVACCRLYESAFLSQGNTICMFFYIFISFYLMFLLFLSSLIKPRLAFISYTFINYQRFASWHKKIDLMEEMFLQGCEYVVL